MVYHIAIGYKHFVTFFINYICIAYMIFYIYINIYIYIYIYINLLKLNPTNKILISK